MKYLPHVRPKLVPKLKTLRIGSFDISNIPTSILMSKIISIKYLPLGRPKLVAKLNLEFTEIRHIDISNMPIWILMSKMVFMKYLPAVRPN